MADSRWALELGDNIFTIFETKLNSLLLSKYPDMLVTTADYSESNAQFPTVYFKELPSVEIGIDLERKDINGVLFSAQIDVYSNISRAVAKEVITEATMILKSMAFEVTSMPEITSNNAVFRAIIRANRIIGANDII